MVYVGRDMLQVRPEPGKYDMDVNMHVRGVPISPGEHEYVHMSWVPTPHMAWVPTPGLVHGMQHGSVLVLGVHVERERVKAEVLGDDMEEDAIEPEKNIPSKGTSCTNSENVNFADNLKFRC